jgi:hypothetical protein
LRQYLFEIMVAQLEGIEFDQHGAVGGMKIADAWTWLQLEQAQEPADMLVCLRGDLLAEIDQERLIAGAPKSRGLGSRWEHARLLYCVTPGTTA